MCIIILSFMCTFTILWSSQAALDKDLYGQVRWLLLGEISTRPLLTMSKGMLLFIFNKPAETESSLIFKTLYYLECINKTDKIVFLKWHTDAFCILLLGNKDLASVIVKNPWNRSGSESLCIVGWTDEGNRRKCLDLQRLLLFIFIFFFSENWIQALGSIICLHNAWPHVQTIKRA